MYAGQFVEQLILYLMVIAENRIKICSGEYVGESYMGPFMLRSIDCQKL